MTDFTEIFDEKFHYSKYGKKENRTNTEKNKHEKAGLQSHDTILHYLTCTPNMNTLACTVSQKYWTKYFKIQSMKRKKVTQIQGRINMRRQVRNPTIQYIIINLHINYDYTSFHSFTEIFDEKFHHSRYGKKDKRPTWA